MTRAPRVHEQLMFFFISIPHLYSMTLRRDCGMYTTRCTGTTWDDIGIVPVSLSN